MKMKSIGIDHPWHGIVLTFCVCLLACGLRSRADEICLGSLKANRILFFGNSITLHPPAPTIGWNGNWGMAASAEEKDYVHLLLNAIAKSTGHKPDVRVATIVDFEQHYEKYDAATKLKDLLAFKPDIIVLAVGENVPTLASEQAKSQFKAGFTRLLTTLQSNGHPAVFVRSSFWPEPIRDTIMRQAASASGCVFVDISRLGSDESHYARSERHFAHNGVGAHPGDKGMKAIATAILDVMSKNSGQSNYRSSASIIGLPH